MDEIIGIFIAEAGELLLQLEDDCMALEEHPANADIINNIFRVMHTLKGSAGMVGFKNIQDFTHDFEGLYEKIREGEIPVSTEIIELTLQAKDVILAMLNKNADEKTINDVL